jgi:hypothetical protein
MPWDKGQVSQGALKRIYKKMGFNPTTKGADLMAWSPKQLDEEFRGSKKKLDNDTIRELNGKIPMESWISLLEAYHADHLTESVSESTVNKINEIVDNFSIKNPKIGKQYIPNMFIGVNNEIYVYDSLGNYPAEINQRMTLVNINGPYFTFVNNDGIEKTYPEKEVTEKLYVRTVLIQDQQTFDKYRMWMQVKNKQSIPALIEQKLDKGLKDWMAATGALAAPTNIAPRGRRI